MDSGKTKPGQAGTPNRARLARVVVVASFGLLPLAAIAHFALGARSDTAAPVASYLPESAATAHFRVFFTGDTRGYLNPCGCELGQFGGLPRRATFLQASRRPGDLLLELGNIIQGRRPHDRLRLNYVLEGLQRMQYDVLVPGEGELAFGKDFEEAAKALERPAVVCANLVSSSSGERVFEPWHIHVLPSGSKAAIVGLTSPYQSLPDRYRVVAPAEALGEALAALEGQVDGVFVAGYLKGKPALDLARAFPHVKLVMASFVPKGSPDLLLRGGAPTMVGGERGQYVSWTAFQGGCAAEVGGQQWLGEDVPDHPEFSELVRRHDAEVSTLGEAFAREALARFSAEGRAGSESCRDCHVAEYESWKASKHAHAMETLRHKGQDLNPNCLKCHFQDVGSHDGLDSVRGVGCESCHGNGAAHVRVHRQGPRQGAIALNLLGRHGVESCIACHDKENSRDFEFGKYWERIAHGAISEAGSLR